MKRVVKKQKLRKEGGPQELLGTVRNTITADDYLRDAVLL